MKNYFQKLLYIDYELRSIYKWFTKSIPKNLHVLDVGCGEGRYLKLLSECGYSVQGVEKNTKLAEELKQEGYRCVVPNDLSDDIKYDVIIMSHIIEHFNPDDLLEFLDSYLDKLKVGGKLIIATPLYHQYFYDDFDHVKPYHPNGIQMLFSPNTQQIQYQARNKLTLGDIWFRRSPLMPGFSRHAILNTTFRRFHQLRQILYTLLYRISFGLIGQKDGWVGVFTKIHSS